jgi:hypothetical protein
MEMTRRPTAVLFLSAILLLAGCGAANRDLDKEKIEAMTGEPMKETVPVSGTILVDGTPTAGVNIFAYKGGEKRESAARARSGPDGVYCWTTYQPCDGLPPGEYKLGFTNVPDEGKGKKEGQDVFKGKYKDPSKNEFTLNVKSGEAQTEVKYELKK